MFQAVLLLVWPMSPTQVAILLDIFSMCQVPMTVWTTLKCHKAYMDAQVSQSLCITSTRPHSVENCSYSCSAKYSSYFYKLTMYMFMYTFIFLLIIILIYIYIYIYILYVISIKYSNSSLNRAPFPLTML